MEKKIKVIINAVIPDVNSEDWDMKKVSKEYSFEANNYAQAIAFARGYAEALSMFVIVYEVGQTISWTDKYGDPLIAVMGTDGNVLSAFNKYC